jgi:hypothetical protein
MRRYRARRRAAGLRLERRWVPAAGSRTGSPFSDHRILDARSLALHALIARKIARAPGLLDIARRNLDRWRAARGTEPPALAEWRAILARPWREVAAVLTDPGEEATRLRQSSPFAGVLSAAERRRIYEAFRA